MLQCSSQSELHSYRTRYPQSTTVLVKPENVSTTSPATGMPPPQGDSSDLITIPHVLLPTLSLLRSHITALTRDNDALRYTFLGQASPNTSLQPVASSSKVTLDVPMTPSSSIAPLPVPQVFGRIERYGPVSDVDLEAVVGRVRELLKENEELGEMMLQAGKTGGREWQQLVDGKSSRLCFHHFHSNMPYRCQRCHCNPRVSPTFRSA